MSTGIGKSPAGVSADTTHPNIHSDKKDETNQKINYSAKSTLYESLYF